MESTSLQPTLSWRIFRLCPTQHGQPDESQVLALLQQAGIEAETGQALSVGQVNALRFEVQASQGSIDALRALTASQPLPKTDWLFEAVGPYTGKPALACFDMDSTLIQAEVIDELAKEAGIGEQVAAITEEAMQGKIDFRESFTRRMGLLKGLDLAVLETVYQRIALMDGAEALFAGLRAKGVRTAILSGGFTYFANRLRERLGIDEVHANVLHEEQGVLTGQVVEPIVDATVKAERLQGICQQQGFAVQAAMAVGDGANDLKMLAVAGIGVAFHAKPVVREQARFSLNHCGLDALLVLLEP